MLERIFGKKIVTLDIDLETQKSKVITSYLYRGETYIHKIEYKDGIIMMSGMVFNKVSIRNELVLK